MNNKEKLFDLKNELDQELDLFVAVAKGAILSLPDADITRIEADRLISAFYLQEQRFRSKLNDLFEQV